MWLIISEAHDDKQYWKVGIGFVSDSECPTRFVDRDSAQIVFTFEVASLLSAEEIRSVRVAWILTGGTIDWRLRGGKGDAPIIREWPRRKPGKDELHEPG